MIIPSINCENFECVKERLKIASEIFAPSQMSNVSGPAKGEARQRRQLSDHWVHLDVSDGKFTPHVSWNEPEQISNLKSQISNLKLEVHLMVEDPEIQADRWLRAGAKRIIVHLESMTDIVVLREKCEKYGAELFIAIRPETDAARLLAYENDVSGFLLLAVSPGPSGQAFKMEILDKIKFLRGKFPNILLEVDGGINLKTAQLAKNAGANLFVAGAYLFNDNNPRSAYLELLDLVK